MSTRFTRITAGAVYAGDNIAFTQFAVGVVFENGLLAFTRFCVGVVFIPLPSGSAQCRWIK